MSTYECVVIGAGAVGAATAYHLAADGRRVLLLEQFSLGHSRGSSHGGSRIIRHSHAELDYAALVPPAWEAWRRLESESGMALLQRTGGLDMGPAGEAGLAARAQTMRSLGITHEQMRAIDVEERFPQFRLPPDWIALHHADAGILSAAAAVKAMVTRAQAMGAVVQEQSRVLVVEQCGSGVAVTVDGPGGIEHFQAGAAVICAGPWAKGFLAQMGLAPATSLRVTHQQYAYFRLADDRARTRFARETCPVYLVHPAPYFYGFPVHERPGRIKVGIELDGSSPMPDIDPNKSERRLHAGLLDVLRQAVDERLVGVDTEDPMGETCLYTMSPDGDFIIDRHPRLPQILIGAGFSGRGFKFSLVSGRILADLLDTAPGYDAPAAWRDRFSLQRFALPHHSSGQAALGSSVERTDATP